MTSALVISLVMNLVLGAGAIGAIAFVAGRFTSIVERSEQRTTQLVEVMIRQALAKGLPDYDRPTIVAHQADGAAKLAEALGETRPASSLGDDIKE